MQLYNGLTRRLESYLPAGGKTTLYVCGITPYDTTHLGHCFTYATFDILIRYLEFSGGSVSYVQNVTDIDDDILRKARQAGDDWRSLVNLWTIHFIDDNRALNIRPPDYFPRATGVIGEIIDVVEALLAAGMAYESSGNVYFHVADDQDFGKLSRMTYDEMLPIANERGNDPDDPHKRDPLDFVLWQAQAPGEPAWQSPWGPGRPGWHIECSTMSAKFLGQPIDIHGGGADLLFPHHECEIAQSEWATGHKPFTRFWMHIAMVRYQGEKMSKSLGNLVMVRDLLQAGWTADAIRLCMAGHHYREAWNYEHSDLEQSAGLADKLRQAVLVEGGSGESLNPEPVKASFLAAMENDLDTPGALRSLIELADDILAGFESDLDVARAQDALREMSAVLGLRLDRSGPEDAVIAGWQAHRQGFENGD